MKKVFLSFLLVSLIFTGTALANPLGKDTLVVGTDATWNPFEFVDENGEITGFDIDIAKAVAKGLGVKVEFKNIAWDGLVPNAVLSKRVDMIVSGVTITEERKEIVSFSDPYYTSAQVLIGKESFNKVKGPEDDFTGVKVGVQIGTTGEFVANDVLAPKGAELRVYNAFGDAMMDLTTGRIDLVIGDAPTAETYQKERSGYKQVGGPVQAEYYGLVFRKDNPELIKAVNQVLADLKASGEYQKIYDKWFSAE